jgi:hypothetical protein
VAAAARMTEIIFGTNTTASPSNTKPPTTPTNPMDEVRRSDASNGKVTPVKSIDIIKFLLKI